MSDSADRTIPATPRRRELARRQGLMPLASLPAWAASVATALLLLPAWARATFPAATAMMRDAIGAAAAGPAIPPRTDLLLPAALVLPTLAVAAAAAAVGLTVRLLLDGGGWSPGRAAASFQRINPLAGLSRIFSLATLASIAGHAGGLALLVTTAWFSAGPLVTAIAGGGAAEDPVRLFGAAWRAILPVAVAAATVAACTWALARLRFERRIRMTPQEHADEARSMQADPKVRLMRQQRRHPAPAAHGT